MDEAMDKQMADLGDQCKYALMQPVSTTCVLSMVVSALFVESHLLD